MSYCAFENTANDLSDCVEKLRSLIDNHNCKTLTDFQGVLENDYELFGLKRLVLACRDIVDIVRDNDCDL